MEEARERGWVRRRRGGGAFGVGVGAARGRDGRGKR